MTGVGDKQSFLGHLDLFKLRYRFRVKGQEIWCVQYPEYEAVAVAYLLRMFVFPLNEEVPEASFNLEESMAGRFYGVHHDRMHYNMGPAPEDVTVTQFLERAVVWLEEYSGVPSTQWEQVM